MAIIGKVSIPCKSARPGRAGGLVSALARGLAPLQSEAPARLAGASRWAGAVNMVRPPRLSVFVARRLRAAGVLLAGCLLLGVPRAWDVERVMEVAQQRGPRVAQLAQQLRALIDKAGPLDTQAKLSLINSFFNQRVSYAEDLEVWGVIDYWASPLETLEKGRGDCEDYAIAKYFSLLAAGVPGEQLRMVYVRAQLQGRSVAHMVLAHYASPDAEPSILDNLQTELRPASARRDLQPVFSFNAEGLWSGVGSTSAGNPVTRLSQWRDLLAKARAEGF